MYAAPGVDLARRLERLLYRRINDIDCTLGVMGYRVRLGIEDEVYIAGPRAHDFLAEGSAALDRLRSAFPEVGRVYREADVVSLRGTSLRLGLPRVRKWEVTTRHVGRDGSKIAPERQARVVTAIRDFIITEAARTGHRAHYGARPIRDLRDLIGPPAPFRMSERELLASLQRQVRSTRFAEAVRAEARHRASDVVFRALCEALPDACAADIRVLVRDVVYRNLYDRVMQRAGYAVARQLRRRIAEERRGLAELAARIRKRIGEATSLGGVCGEPDAPIEPGAVPACGVDINLSLSCAGRSAFHDPRATDQASALFHCVGNAAVACVGRNSGSLLPFAQSYSPETFERLFRVDLHVPNRAGIGPKCTGAACKSSPDSIAANPSRAAEHDFDELGPDTIRLEMRVGEAGGGDGRSNALSAPHAVLLMMIAARLGVENYHHASSPPPSLRDHPAEQPLNVSHEDALASFERSVVLRDGYGSALHRLVTKHARLVLQKRPC